MARKQIYVSDISGDVIADGKGATVTINYNDARKPSVRVDVTDAEADSIASHGMKVPRRGRKPKAADAAPEGS